MLPSRKLVLILPDNRERLAGGNIYNNHLVEELRRRDMAIAVCNVDEFLLATGGFDDSLIGIDTLLLDRLPELLNRRPLGSKYFLIVHYLPSIQPDFTETERRRRKDSEDRIFSELDGFLVTSQFTAEVAGVDSLLSPLLLSHRR